MAVLYEMNELECCHNQLTKVYCFICGKLIADSAVNILGTETPWFCTSLADQLSKIIGHNYLIVLSQEDKACGVCLDLVNHVDELEYQLWIAKQKVIDLLKCTYKIHLQGVVHSPRSSEDCAQDGEEEEKNNVASNIKTKTEVLDCKAENLDKNTLFEELETKAHVDVSCIPKSPDYSSLLVELPYNNSIDRNISLDVLKGEVIKESSEEDDPILYSTIHSSSSKNVLDINSEQINEPVIGVQFGECGEEGKDVIKNVQENTEKGKVENQTKNKIFLCEICDVPFPKPYLLTRHKRVHQKSSKKVTCSLCNIECYDRLHYIYHRKNKHDLLNRLTCTLCDKNFSSNKDLKNHLLTAHEGEEFQCTSCGEQFKRHSQFANHKLYAHGKRNCRVCGKHISNDIKLRQHENRHAWIESKNLICDVCGRSFKTPGGLRVHKVSHTGNYKFFCEFCGRGFMSTVILEEHKGVHTREERYVCDICGRKFVLYSTFHLHKQWHKDPFPFPCKICKKKFKYRSVRSIHIRRDHTGQSPYKCHYCSAEFLKSISLKKHITSHTKEYPYNCNICFKGFVQRRNLARHMARIHNDNSFNQEPKFCEYKVVLRPDEFPPSVENT